MKDRIVQEWFERGKRDSETAKLIFTQKGYYDEVVFLVHQAIEKYPKGYLIFHGWKLKKIHDIEMLLVEATKYNELFDFLDFGRKITAFYYENRYPPGPPSKVSEEETEEIVNSAEEVISKIKAGTGYEKGRGGKSNKNTVQNIDGGVI